jgi:hypothetical protein
MPNLAQFYESLCTFTILRRCFGCFASCAARQGPEVDLNPSEFQIVPCLDDRLQVRAASLFEAVGKSQNSFLREGGAIHLQADRQTFRGLAAGN